MKTLLRAIASTSLVITGIIVVLWFLGVSPSTVLAGGAILSTIPLALSIALGEVLQGFVKGRYVMLERKFEPGDIIQIGEDVGRVIERDFRITTLLDLANNDTIIISNAQIFSSVVRIKNPVPPK